MKTRQIVTASLLALAVGALCSCGTISKGIAANGSSAQQLVFPAPGDATLKGGTFPSIEQLRAVKPGMTKDQLYQMFGPPHFHEGVFNVREWDYLFNFRTGQGSQYVTCEFKVLFDTHDIARSYYWKPETCGSLIQPKPEPVAKAAPPPPTQPIVLSGSTLFGFNQSQLSTAGRIALHDLLAPVTAASKVETVRVIGYTDRIGSVGYNLKLSQKRASTVLGYLVAHGVPQDSILAEGRGEADPIVPCFNVPAAELIACLAPNRRVEIHGSLSAGK